MLFLKNSLKIKFYDTINLISKYAGNSFSGIGILLYDTIFFSKKHYSDLRPSIICPKGFFLGEKKLINYLLEISEIYNPLHDGFIFFNEMGQLTHISQYFAPLPNGKIIPNECYGTRYRTAQYGSLLKGVLLIGIVCHDKNYFIFSNGEVIKLNCFVGEKGDQKLRIKI